MEIITHDGIDWKIDLKSPISRLYMRVGEHINILFEYYD